MENKIKQEEEVQEIDTSLQQELAQAQEKIQEYTQHLQRLQAEFENYMKRTDKEKQEFFKYSSHKTLSKLISFIDDFERAVALLKKETQNASLQLGFDMMLKQFHKLLEEEGVTPIPALGLKYDPYHHEILDRVAHEAKEDMIVEELQKGYFYHDRVLRPSRVRVSGGKQ